MLATPAQTHELHRSTMLPSLNSVYTRVFRSEPALDCFYAFFFDESKIRRRRRRRRMVLLLKDKRRRKMGLIISLISSLSRYFGKVWSAEIHSCFSSHESNQLRLPRIKSRLPTKETELIPRLVFFITESGNDRTTGALCRSWTRTMLSMERRLNVHGGKVARRSLRTRHVVSWLFMGRMNTRRRGNWITEKRSFDRRRIVFFFFISVPRQTLHKIRVSK